MCSKGQSGPVTGKTVLLSPYTPFCLSETVIKFIWPFSGKNLLSAPLEISFYKLTVPQLQLKLLHNSSSPCIPIPREKQPNLAFIVFKRTCKDRTHTYFLCSLRQKFFFSSLRAKLQSEFCHQNQGGVKRGVSFLMLKKQQSRAGAISQQ